MKEERYFNYKRKGHIIPNYLEKAKISAITNTSDIDDIKNINQGKEKLLLKTRKEV